jgi:hypothetical protein
VRSGAFPGQRLQERIGQSVIVENRSLLPDYLEDGLAEFGRSCEEFEREHM